MEDKIEKLKPADRIEFVIKEYPNRKQKNSKEDNKNNSDDFKQIFDGENEKINIHKNDSQEKSRNVTTEDIKEHMEANSPSNLYRLMNIMNTDPEEAIKYLAELSNKNAKTTKPRKQKDDEYR